MHTSKDQESILPSIWEVVITIWYWVKDLDLNQLLLLTWENGNLKNALLVSTDPCYFQRLINEVLAPFDISRWYSDIQPRYGNSFTAFGDDICKIERSRLEIKKRKM